VAVLPSPAVAANDTGSPAFRLRAQANSRSQSLMRCVASAQCKKLFYGHYKSYLSIIPLIAETRLVSAKPIILFEASTSKWIKFNGIWP
jgi:hypothetical protein